MTIKGLVAVALVTLSLSCGGGSPPANERDLCERVSVAICDRAFQCAPQRSRDVAFTAEFGANVAECKKKAASNCPTIQKCSGFEPDLATTCLQKVAFLSCQEVEFFTTPQECTAIGAFDIVPFTCDGAVRPQSAVQFCNQFITSICDREFECTPASSRDLTFTSNFGASSAECKAMNSPNCASILCSPFDQNLATECLGSISTASCSSLESALESGFCQAACP